MISLDPSEELCNTCEKWDGTVHIGKFTGELPNFVYTKPPRKEGSLGVRAKSTLHSEGVRRWNAVNFMRGK